MERESVHMCALINIHRQRINKLFIFKDIFCYVCLHGDVCFPCRHEDLSQPLKRRFFKKPSVVVNALSFQSWGGRQEDLQSSPVSQASQIGEFHGH